MSISDLIFSMQIGEEIELYICGKCYFLQPNYKSFNKDWDSNNPAYPLTVIYDSQDYENPKKIFEGHAECVVDYEFESKYTLRHDLEKFKFVW